MNSTYPRDHIMSNYLPVIGITMGDAAGVGAEVVVKSLAHASVYAQCRPLVIGDAKRLERANQIVGGTMKIRRIEDATDARYEQGTIDCIDLGLIPDDLPFGELSALAGDAAYQYIKRAVELAQAGKIDAICTAPLNKEALHAGGHKYPGHTEMLAHLTGVDARQMREHFRVARILVAARMQRFLVQRRRADRIDLARLREFDGALDVLIRGIARQCRQLAERQVVRNQAEVDAVDRALLVTRIGCVLDAANLHRPADDLVRALEALRVADHER